jgi:hypothetical protein
MKTPPFFALLLMIFTSAVTAQEVPQDLQQILSLNYQDVQVNQDNGVKTALITTTAGDSVRIYIGTSGGTQAFEAFWRGERWIAVAGEGVFNLGTDRETLLRLWSLEPDSDEDGVPDFIGAVRILTILRTYFP